MTGRRKGGMEKEGRGRRKLRYGKSRTNGRIKREYKGKGEGRSIKGGSEERNGENLM